MIVDAIAIALAAAGGGGASIPLAVGWDDVSLHPVEEVMGGRMNYVAEFSAMHRSLAGRQIVLSGYLRPVAAGDRPIYLLSPKPAECLQHLHVEPGQFLEVALEDGKSEPALSHDSPVKVVGTLELSEIAPSFLRLKQARVFHSKSSGLGGV